MLDRLAVAVVRRRKEILVATGIALVAALIYGAGVFGPLRSGGFTDPAAESTRAAVALSERFGQGDANLVVLVTARPGGAVDDPEVASAGTALTARLAAIAGVESAAGYWTLGSPPPLRSARGDRALILVHIAGTDRDDHIGWVEEHRGELVGRRGPISVGITGVAAAYEEVSRTIEHDATRAELLAFPLTALALLLVFGSLVAAGLPLAVGALAIVGTVATLRAIASVTDVSIFSLNLTTALGLGLAIDYSLFVVSRFREELRRGLHPYAATRLTITTAGRTVLFSAFTVAASLAALLVFPLYFLRSFAFAGAAVVMVAALVSVTTLPALLAVLGARVDRFAIRRRPPPELGRGFWHRLATVVMRRPVPMASAVIVLLVALGAPFLGIRFGNVDDRVLPRSAQTRAAGDVIRHEFTSAEQGALIVVAGGLATGDPRLAGYAERLSDLRGVGRVDSALGTHIGGRVALPAPPQGAPGSAAFARFSAPLQSGAGTPGTAGTWLSVVPSVEPLSADGQRLARSVRAVDSPVPVVVGGQSAELVDSKAALAGRLPLAGAIIVLVTFVVLFLMFGSLLVPVKALILNLLSLTATFGAMVWVFQEGHGAGLLDFTPTGDLQVAMPMLMFCIAFGLSMDYEVFLLSRIKEQHDRGASTVESVATGLEQTGRIVTAAALLLSVVFLAFATSSVSVMKLFGVGVTLAVLMDATLIRGILVPAFMRLAGEANWWAPGPLRRLHQRSGLSEAGGTIDARDARELDAEAPLPAR